MYLIILASIILLGVLGLVLFVVGVVKNRKNEKDQSSYKMLMISGNSLAIVLILSIFGAYNYGKFDNYTLRGKYLGISLAYYCDENDILGTDILLNLGVTPNCDENNRIAGEYAEDVFISFLVQWCDHPEYKKYKYLVEKMIHHGADVNKLYRQTDYDLKEIIEGDMIYTEVTPLILSFGYTPLMRATEASNFEIVKTLVENGAKLDATSENGLNAYMIATSKSSDDEQAKKIADYLKEQGADTSVTYEDFLNKNYENIDGIYYLKEELDFIEKLANGNKEITFDRSNPNANKGIGFGIEVDEADQESPYEKIVPITDEIQENIKNDSSKPFTIAYLQYLHVDIDDEIIDLSSLKHLENFTLEGEVKEVTFPEYNFYDRTGTLIFHRELPKLEKITVPSKVSRILIVPTDSGGLDDCTEIEADTIYIHNDVINQFEKSFTIGCSKNIKIEYYGDSKKQSKFKDNVALEYYDK